jgi:hypothetical protein
VDVSGLIGQEALGKGRPWPVQERWAAASTKR